MGQDPTTFDAWSRKIVGRRKKVREGGGRKREEGRRGEGSREKGSNGLDQV